MIRYRYPFVGLAALTLIFAWGCKKKEDAPATAATPESAAKVEAPEAPPVLSDAAQKLAAGTKVAVLEMEKGGVVEIEILAKETPKTAANFIELVEDKFYDAMPVHRVEDFVVQAGDGVLIGKGVGDRRLDVEADKRKCVRGAMSMARGMTPGAKEYGDTSPTQFFILKKDSPHLDKDFCVFGVVLAGMDVIDGIKVNDVIKRVRVLTTGEAAPASAAEK